MPALAYIEEVVTLPGGGGTATTDWIDACGASTVRVGFGFEIGGGTGESVSVEQSTDQTTMVGIESSVGSGSKGQADVPLSARFFRVKVTGDATNTPCHISVQEV